MNLLRAWVALAIAVAAPPVLAHDMINAEVAERYLADVTQNAAILKSTAAAPRRAEAAYQLGSMLDEIREILNRDIAAHGQVQGLASNRLVLELKARGAPLQPLPNGRFAANIGYYRDALNIAPRGEREGDALFRLLQGYFYDSFDDDPLAPRQQDWTQLTRQIGYAERLMARVPSHPDIEEARFILLIHYIQAARRAPDAKAARAHAALARAVMAEFEHTYPDSLRAAALPMLRARLENP